MAVCASCSNPLTLRIELDPSEIDYNSSAAGLVQDVPDDVQLVNCGCHFHWQCILDVYEVTRCPHCSRDISSTNSSGGSQILCNLLNEGGLQENLDILPILSEELYLKAYPEDRKPRAFLEFCREGDVEAIVDLLKAIDGEDGVEEDDQDAEEDAEEDADMDDASQSPTDSATVLRYQDPIGQMQSGLHIAVNGGHTDITWLLLLLASNLDSQHFPPQVQAAAEQLAIKRVDQTDKEDIRVLKDSEGKVAADYVSSSLGIDASLLKIE